MVDKRSYLLALSTFAASLAATDARACIARKNNAPALARLIQLDATTWRVHAPGYVTRQLGIGVHFCAIGVLPPVSGPITGVRSVSLITEATGSTNTAFTWSASGSLAASFARIKAGTWTAFLGQVVGPDAGGADTLLTMTLEVSSGTSQAQLQTALGQTTIGTDAATSGGDLLDDGRFLLTPTTFSGVTWNRNEKPFFNTAHATAATRAGLTGPDTLYFMQPKEHRFGQGDAGGWRLALQDSDGSTAETVRAGMVKYDGATTKPDLGTGGTIVEVAFTLFGTGSGSQSVEWTLTPAGAVAVPRTLGVSVVLPEPPSTSDVVTVLTQEGTGLKIPLALRQQWTFVKSGTTAADYRSIGTTLHFSCLFDDPVLQIFNRSTAYGPAETLLGPEALFHDSVRSDQLGFRVESATHAGGFSIAFVGPSYVATPIPTPFGDSLLSGVLATGFPFLLDGNGLGTTISVPVPAGKFTFASQALFFKITGSSLTDLQFSDAELTQTQ